MSVRNIATNPLPNFPLSSGPIINPIPNPPVVVNPIPNPPIVVNSLPHFRHPVVNPISNGTLNPAPSPIVNPLPNPQLVDVLRATLKEG